MTDSSPNAGFVYALEHPAWRCIGVCKIGCTSREPAKRLSEITSSSGLIAPGHVHHCVWVSDRRAVERRIKDDILRHKRVRRRRELFRVTPEEARAAIELAAAGVVSTPWRVDRPARARARRGAWQAPRRPWWGCSVFRWRRGDARALALVVLALAAVAALGGWW